MLTFAWWDAQIANKEFLIGQRNYVLYISLLRMLLANGANSFSTTLSTVDHPLLTVMIKWVS